MRAKQALLAFRKLEKGGYIYDDYRVYYFSNVFSMGNFIHDFCNNQYYFRIIGNLLSTNCINN